MRRVSIPYGRGYINFLVDEQRLLGVLKPEHVNAEGLDQQEVIIKALENPIASPRVCELATDKKRILLITSDHTRPIPSTITLPLYLKEIRRGSPNAEIRILIATGMHRPTTLEEMYAKFGKKIVGNEIIINHVSTDYAHMSFKGILPSGGELWINDLVDWADLVVSEGFIEPHFFAGFSGGRKSILPGIASQKTVLYNHNANFIASPYAVQGNLINNPIHRDMLFASKQAKLAFILNVLIDTDKKVIAAFAGDCEAAHAAGCTYCLNYTTVPRVEADIVITSNGGYPMDQNVYQAVKGITTAENCVRYGGVIIMCAALGDGHGGETFFRWFAEHKNLQEITDEINNIQPDKTLADQWQAQVLAQVLSKVHCIFVTGEENRGIIEDMNMHWAGTPSDALMMAYKIMEDDATVCIIPDGVGVIIK